MQSFEEIYILRTIDALKAKLYPEIVLAWDAAEVAYIAAGYDPVDDNESPRPKVKILPPPMISDITFLPWSLEEKPITGSWAIVVLCDVSVLDSNNNLSMLGNYELTIGVAYQAKYIESSKYAALSRMRRAVMRLIQKEKNAILYNGGELELASTKLSDINEMKGNRTVVSEVVYNLIAQG